MDEVFTHKHLYQIITKHAGRLISPNNKAVHVGRARHRSTDAEADDRAGLTFGDFARALQEIGETKLGPGKNGLHRLVYLNIIRFANLDGHVKAEPAKTVIPPRAKRDGLQDPLLRLVVDSAHLGFGGSSLETGVFFEENTTKPEPARRSGSEISLIKRHFSNIFKNVVEAFVFFDRNGNDFITMHEFRRGIELLKLAEVNADRVMRELDLGCKKRNGEDLDLISFIRIFAWQPAKEAKDWMSTYERTKLESHAIVERTRDTIRRRSMPSPPGDVDLDLITACSVLGTRWEEVRQCFLSMRLPGSPSRLLSPSPSRRSPLHRRSLSPFRTSPSQRDSSRVEGEERRGDQKNESMRSESKVPGHLGSIVDAIGKQEFFEAVSSVPLDLTHDQALKAFNFLDVDKNGWFHILQAEDVLRKAGYLPRIPATKTSSTVMTRSHESVMQEMIAVECERTLALSALADQWASHELDLVNSRHKDRLKNVFTIEEQVRFDRATTAAQRTLTKAMEKQFSSIHQTYDERVSRLRGQLSPTPKSGAEAKAQGHSSRRPSPLQIAVDVSSGASRRVRCLLFHIVAQHGTK